MILSKNNKQKTETDHGQEEQTLGSWKMDGHLGKVGDTNCCIWNGWAMGSYSTAQGNVCDCVTLRTTELDETL